MAAQIILSLSILVGLHEAGHMFAAKYFGMATARAISMTQLGQLNTK